MGTARRLARYSGLACLLGLSIPAISSELLDLINVRENEPFHRARIDSLLDQPVDRNERTSFGSSHLTLAMETLALFRTPSYRADGEAVVRKILSRTPDLSLHDHRGAKPFHYFFVFGNYAQSLRPLFQDYMAMTPDLSPPATPGIASVMGMTLRYLPPAWVQTLVDKKDEYKLDLFELDGDGQNPLHYAARASSDAEAKLAIYVAAIGLNEAKKLASSPDQGGETPLMVAASNGYLSTAKYLVETLGADVNAVSREGLTALAIARGATRSDVVRFLQGLGATELVSSTTLSCSVPNAEPFGSAQVTQLITQCGITSMEELLPLFPLGMRAQTFLFYGSRSMQESSFAHPRAVMIADKGLFSAAFNGHSSQRGFNTLEMMDFNPATKKFELRELVFKNNQAPAMSQLNPSKCLGCHGAEPKPNWERYPFWSGAYFSEVAMYPAEAAKFKSYQETLANEPLSRYQHLLPFSGQSRNTVYGKLTIDVRGQIDSFYETLMGQKVARQIHENADLKPYRYALLGAMSCRHVPIEEFIPASRASQFTRSYKFLYDAARMGLQAEIRQRVSEQRTMIPGSAGARFTLETLRDDGTGPWGIVRDAERVGRVEYIVDNVLGPRASEDWYVSRPPYKRSPTIAAWEVAYFQEALDPVADLPIRELYVKDLLPVPARPFFGLYFRPTANTPKLCDLLKEASLKALH